MDQGGGNNDKKISNLQGKKRCHRIDNNNNTQKERNVEQLKE